MGISIGDSRRIINHRPISQHSLKIWSNDDKVLITLIPLPCKVGAMGHLLQPILTAAVEEES